MTDAFLAELRAADAERYLLSLFYPAAARPQVWAFTAFAAEIAAIPEKTHEEMIGLIRLAWWREALDAIYAGLAPPAHPIATRLAGAIAVLEPPRLWFDAMLEARGEQIESPRILDRPAFARFAQATAGMLARLSLLSVTRDPALLEMAGRAGEIYGMVGLWRSLPYQLSQGHCLLPEEEMIRHGLPAAFREDEEMPGFSDPRWKAFNGAMGHMLASAHRSLIIHGPAPIHLLHRLSAEWLKLLPRRDPGNWPNRLPFLTMKLLWNAALTKS